MRVQILCLCLLLAVAWQPAVAKKPVVNDDESLLSAAAICDVDLSRSLVNRGANPNKLADTYGSTALMQAVEQAVTGNQAVCTDEVQVLLEGGGDPNLENSNGKSAMSAAATWEVAPEVMDALLAHKGNPDIQMHITRLKGQTVTSDEAAMEGTTPLMIMAMDTSLELQLSSEKFADHDRAVHKLQAILKKANPNLQEVAGRTALMMAAAYHNAFIVRNLLAAGANPALKDKNGETALDYARRASQIDIVKLLSN
jgi:ankyrin repeat protein